MLRISPRFVPLLAAACLLGCATADPDADCTIKLEPGSDDQTSVQTNFIDARPGSTICLGAGRFSFETELSISLADITVRGAGKGKTILDFSRQDLGSNGLALTGDRITIQDLDVFNTPGDALRATAVKDVAFRNVGVSWEKPASVNNGAYGLYPVECDGVIIDGCSVSGARDAGVYVGQSHHVLVANTEASGNVAGIEIENTIDAEVRDCHAHDNVAGILVFNLPNLPLQGGSRANIHHNVVENNNIATFAEAGTIVSNVPSGIGIMILSSDDNEVHHNEVSGNDSVGALMLSYTPLVFSPFDDPNFNSFPQGNYLHDNTFSGNGTKPDSLLALIIPKRPVPDILWDGCLDPKPDRKALVNCLGDNHGATYMNLNICGSSGPSQDQTKVTCKYASLPSQAR